MNTEKKIMRVLEDNPSGLSISDLARKTELHRNTVSPNVVELMREGKLKYKMVGQAKVYYLSHDHGLHGGIKMDEGKNVYAGVGISKNDDPFEAGKEAAEMAVKECGKEPIFGLVFVSERYDHEKLVKGLDMIFKDVPYCGCTSLGEVTQRGISHDSCVVMALSSKYIHVGIGTGENVYEKPRDAIKKASKEALSRIKLDTYVDPYITYLAMKKKTPKDLLTMKPYRLLVITPGFGDKIPLDQEDIIKGLFEEVGMYTPVIGAGAISSSMVTNKYVFTNNKVFDNAILVVAMISMVKTGSSIAHGFVPTGKTFWINKGESSLAFELNNRSAKEVYKELNDIDLDKWTMPFGKEGADLDSREMHTYIKHPFGIQTPSKNYILRNILPIFPDKDFIRFSSLVE
ncbi:MAG: helix-turn-helix domain-containing protein, partial [Candidatus Altiarchaeales archaeon]|nr:helix-turn-helix domain-containing protein [Candidatus Altiarchaeales archaeon]